MRSDKPLILVIDDDARLTSLLSRFLEKRGFGVLTADNGVSGLKKISFNQPDLVILDVMMPGDNGLEVLKKIRKDSNVPVIMLTAMGETTDKITGLKLGADDYVAKPFEPAEIEARIEAVLRRHAANDEDKNIETEIVTFKTFAINRLKRTITVQDNEIDLSSSEFELLLYLAENKHTVISREKILERLRGDDFESFDRSVDILISRLRKKLGENSASIIKTVHGSGYMFQGD